MRAGFGISVCVVLAVVALLAVFAGSGQTSGTGDTREERNGAAVTQEGGEMIVRAGDATVRTGGGGAEARAGDVVASAGEDGVGDEARDRRGGGIQEEVRDGEAVLRIVGAPGTKFSGTCAVGGEENELEGEVPESFTYDLRGGEELECEIRNGGGGRLQTVLVTGDDRVAQQTNSRGATVSFTYSEGGVSSSTSSGSSNSVSQSSSSSSVNSSSSSTSSVVHSGD